MTDNHPPRLISSVMVSSTFTDLVDHRQAVIDAVNRQGLHPNVMEYNGAQAGPDVIESSLQMVRESAAYVAVISHKYGQTPKCAKSNPENLSITELEFNEAQSLDRPILLFIMSNDHAVLPRDVEQDPENKEKLEAFKARAKRMREGSEVERVYETFDNLEEFKPAAANAIAKLKRHLDEQPPPEETPRVEISVTQARPTVPPLPRPPAFRAVPPYVGSHGFVGRKAQLDTLSDWAGAADPNPVFLFEAIGGSGKSMLTWEWVDKHAMEARDDWAGRFWYSFYDRGATMAAFCRHALAYMTGAAAEDLVQKKTPELTELLIAELNARPWLLVLDGLERVLVAYNRFDAPQLRDEDADTAPDQIADRDPTAAIRSEDDELLRKLAATAPSKLLVTSRLTPRAVMNPSRLPLPGVRKQQLSGLRPREAEAMIQACGVTGTSKDIRAYLQKNCDCHPLVIGVLAGLINEYLPDRGNFDEWAKDPAFGAGLNLGALDLVQRRNHILEAAFDALPEPGRQLLSTMALLYGAADFDILSGINPHMPPKPEKIPEPSKPEGSFLWKLYSEEDKAKRKAAYQKHLKEHEAYLNALGVWTESEDVRAAPSLLADSVRDLEKRGLLQYDSDDKRYDLHPVVRGVAAGRLGGNDKQTLGQRVVDHFSQQAHDPYEQAETLGDLETGLQLVRGLLQMGRFDDAVGALRGDLSNGLLFNLEADEEYLALLRPYFSDGWSRCVSLRAESDSAYIMNDAAGTLNNLGQHQEAVDLFNQCILIDCELKNWSELRTHLSNLSNAYQRLNFLAQTSRILSIARDIAAITDEEDIFFNVRLDLFLDAVIAGRIAEAESLWKQLDSMGRDWPRHLYRPGDAEYWYALFKFCYGELREDDLAKAERLAREGLNRATNRELHALRGEWHLKRSETGPAIESLREAVRLAREAGKEDFDAEAWLALARLRAGDGADVRADAERLGPKTHSLAVAELWRALGETDKAIDLARRTHKWAAADGEPYVRRYELDGAAALLKELGVEPPEVPQYDPSRDEPFPWEEAVQAALEELRAEKRAEEEKAKREAAAEEDE